ncbi:MAG: twin-arginine translocase subunit TatC, partial [Bacteroidales bacterium]|nr:twin-arginine translocase subunit TatC [Bacteroidales bacterium]
IRSETMARYRKHAIVVLLLMSAMITPPDLMTLLLVALPLYLLYEFSRVVLKRVELKTEKG